MSDVPQTIVELHQQMTAFEKKYLIIVGITALIAFVSLIISILVGFFNRRHNRATLSVQLKSAIDTAKNDASRLQVDMSPLRSKNKRTADEQRQLDDLKKIHDAAFEKVLNCYEDSCQRYLNKQVDRGEFRKSYFHDIREYIDHFPELFTEPATRFYSMLQVYREWHKPK